MGLASSGRAVLGYLDPLGFWVGVGNENAFIEFT